MTIQDALAENALPNLELEIILGYLLQKDHSWIIAHPEQELEENIEQKMYSMIERRQKGEPIAYLIGSKEFYGRSFAVDPSVLIPRPSTEGLIDLAVKTLEDPKDRSEDLDTHIIGIARLIRSSKKIRHIVDIGTGSGCVGITLALERPDLRIIATDLSETILDLAKENAARYQVIDRIDFRMGSALDPLKDLGEPFFVVSNPPYIPDEEVLQKDVRDFEPASALFAGREGMDVLKMLVEQAMKHSFCDGLILECREEQVTSIDEILEQKCRAREENH